MARNVRTGFVVLMIAIAALGCSRGPRYVTGEISAGGEVVMFTPAPTTMVIHGGVDEGSTRAAIATALQTRRYVIEADEPARMIARLVSRRVTVRISIDYSPSQIVIQHLDSEGLHIESAVASRRYDAWLRQLTQTIEAELGRPAREAQEAIARAEDAQRRHEQELRDAQQRELDRQSYERLESERLATQRAEAEAQAEQARLAAAQVQAQPVIVMPMPQMQGGIHVQIGRLRFDEHRARLGHHAIVLQAGYGPDPQSVRGIAGGPVSSAQMGFPGGCPGNFEGNAQHTIVLQSDMPYLRMEAPSSGDATLAVVTPDGSVWCDDDSAGSLVPRLHGAFPAGVYQVYVGNYRSGMVEYSLTLSQQ